MDKVKGRDLELNFNVDEPQATTIVDDMESLKQNLLLRLLIERGNLSSLGYPHYGSRIYDFIGKLQSSDNVQLLRRLIKKTILQEKRVAKVRLVDVRQSLVDPNTLNVDILVQAVNKELLKLEIATDL